MSLISDEIIDLLNEYRLDELKQIKSKLSEEEYAQSEYNIVSSRDDDSQKLENVLNEIKDNDVLVKVIHSLKNSIEARNYHNYIDGNGKIKVESVKKDIEQIQTDYMAQENSNATNIVEEAITALTASELHSIAEDFKNQSFEMRSKLLDQWNALTLADKESIITSQSEQLQEIATTEEQRDLIDKSEKTNIDYEIINSKWEKLVKNIPDADADQQAYDDFYKAIGELIQDEKFSLLKDYVQSYTKEKESDGWTKSEIRIGLVKEIKQQISTSNDLERKAKEEAISNKCIDKELEKKMKIGSLFREIGIYAFEKMYEGRIAFFNSRNGNSLEQIINNHLENYTRNNGSVFEFKTDESIVKDIVEMLNRHPTTRKKLDEIVKNSKYRDILNKAREEYEKQTTTATAEVPAKNDTESTPDQELQKKTKKFNQEPIPDKNAHKYYHSQATDLTLDRNVEEVAKKIQAQGGSVEEISVELAKTIEKTKAEQAQHSSSEEQPKGQETESSTPPISENPTTPEEHTQESTTTSPKTEALEETKQNMAIAKQDNSFIGKIKRVFANIKDMKSKDNSKGFFSRLGASIKTVFGNKEEHYEEQDSSSTVPKAENQSQTPTRKDSISYFNQHIEVNTIEAVQKTEESKKENESSKEDDRNNR